MTNNTEDTMLEAHTSDLLALAPSHRGDLATWSEDKRQDFVSLFDKRSRSAQYILNKTARIIIDKAYERHFIGRKMVDKLHQKRSNEYSLVDKPDHRNQNRIGSRSVSELDEIAMDRAELILNELPPVKKAIQIIDPDTAKKMDQRDKLLEKLKALKEQVEEMPVSVNVAELNLDMTVGQLRKMIKDLEKKRKALVDQMSELGAEGQELDSIINKRLFNGLPGLSEAVEAVVIQHFDRAKALDTTTRRVEEKVKFGDSSAAVDLLKGFERDEVKLSDSVREEFKAALDKLNLLGQKKQLKKGKGKK